jgi:hypothetical protein
LFQRYPRRKHQSDWRNRGTIQCDTSGVFHGFLRSPDGTITTFDAPGAGTAAGQDTFVTFTDGINPVGAIALGFADASGMFHAAVRAPDGTFAAL